MTLKQDCLGAARLLSAAVRVHVLNLSSGPQSGSSLINFIHRRRGTKDQRNAVLSSCWSLWKDFVAVEMKLTANFPFSPLQWFNFFFSPGGLTASNCSYLLFFSLCKRDMISNEHKDV